MKKLLALLTCIACCVAANAQTSRIDAIWDVVTDRTAAQTDIWFDFGDYPRCVNLLRFTAATEPHDYEASSDLGWMLENIEHWDEALAIYVRFKEANPDQPDAPFLEAQFYFMKKNYAKVPALLEASISKKPHGNSYRILALAYDKLGKLTDSVRVWKQMISDYPDDKAAPVNLNRVQNKIKAQATPSGG